MEVEPALDGRIRIDLFNDNLASLTCSNDGPPEFCFTLQACPVVLALATWGPLRFNLSIFFATLGKVFGRFCRYVQPQKGILHTAVIPYLPGTYCWSVPESLVAEGWISPAELKRISEEFADVPTADRSQVDFDAVETFKRRVMKVAFQTFTETRNDEDDFQTFCGQQAWWLDDFTRFEAMSEYFGESNWNQWPIECREPVAIPDSILKEIKVAIEFSMFKQFLFDAQWTRLKVLCQPTGHSGLWRYADLCCFRKRRCMGQPNAIST